MESCIRKKVSALGVALSATVLCAGAKAQVGDPATLVKEKLVSEIKLTKASAAHDDIVTAGDVVVLHKDGLIMCSSTSTRPANNTYIHGALKVDSGTQAISAFKKTPWGGGIPDSAVCAQRKFVSGEKFWVTDIRLGTNAILVDTFSDPYNDVRYYGEISFPYPKGAVPPVDAFVKTVSEVITVQPADDKAAAGSDQAAQSGSPAPTQAAGPAPTQAAAPPPPMPAIAPPPPPADAPPPTLEVGQTTDQVTAGFGKPVRVDKLSATKQIYVYKDMRITFTNGKVSNIEEK
jgi:hypothetical protein